METYLLFLISRLWAWFHPFVILPSCFVSLPIIPVLALLASPRLALARTMLSLALLCAAGGCVLVAQCAVSCVGDSGMKISTSCVTPAQPWTMTHPADSICCWPTWSTRTRSSSNAHWPAWRMRTGQYPGKTNMSMGWAWSVVPFLIQLGGGGLNCMFTFTQSVQTRLIERIVAHQWSAQTVTAVIHLLVLRLNLDPCTHICILVLKEGSLYECIVSVVTPTTKILISYPYNNVPGATFVAMTHMNIFFMSAVTFQRHTALHKHTHSHAVGCLKPWPSSVCPQQMPPFVSLHCALVTLSVNVVAAAAGTWTINQ